jgi:dihydrodipicolinate synthase/N-acetylneuraminate lyase
MLLEGLHIPLTTPFHPDGRLNLPKLGANVARTSKSPAAGLIVLGQQGEPTLLTDDESREVLRAAAQAAAPEKVLLAGISRDSVRATLALAHLAAELLYDAILAGVPSIFAFDCPTAAAAASEQSRSTQRRELLLYFQTIADRSPLPASPWKPQSSSPPIPTSSACWTARPAPPRSNRLFAAPRQSSAKSPSRLSSVLSPRA